MNPIINFKILITILIINLSFKCSAQDSVEVQTINSRFIQINLSGGYLRNNIAALNNSLQTNGYNKISENFSQFSISTLIFSKNIVFSYDFSIFSAPKRNNPGNSTNHLSGFGSTFYLGYTLINNMKFRIYPYVGLNQNFTVLKYQDNTPVSNYTSLLNSPQKEATLSFTNYLIDIGISAEKLFKRANEPWDCPQVIRYMALGLRAGYYFRLSNSHKMDYNNHRIGGAPVVGLNGPYLKLSIGLGTKIRTLKWK